MSALEKIGAAVGAVVAGAGVVAELAAEVEREILGVPQSVLLVAIAGALIGVMILPDRDAAKFTGHPAGSCWRRLLSHAVRGLALVVAVVGYAFVAAWLIQVLATVIPALAGAPQLPLAGLSGVVIRRALPGYLTAVDRFSATIGGKT